jgi:hypothetical protein
MKTASIPDLLPPPDFSLPPDMAQLTCKQMIACVTSCSGASFNTCVGNCIAAGSTNGLVFFAPLEMCAEPACYDADGGSDACATTGTGACETCLTTNCSSSFTACQEN